MHLTVTSPSSQDRIRHGPPHARSVHRGDGSLSPFLATTESHACRSQCIDGARAVCQTRRRCDSLYVASGSDLVSRKQLVQFTKNEGSSKHGQPLCRLNTSRTDDVHCQPLIYGDRGSHRALDLDPDLLQPHTYFLRLAETRLREAARRRVEAMKKKMAQELQRKAAEKRREEEQQQQQQQQGGGGGGSRESQGGPSQSGGGGSGPSQGGQSGRSRGGPSQGGQSGQSLSGGSGRQSQGGQSGQSQGDGGGSGQSSQEPMLPAYKRGPWSLWHRHWTETPSASPIAAARQAADSLGFDYFRCLNAIDGDDDDMHLELFSNDRYARCLTDERSHRTAFVTPLPFPLRFEGRWQVVLKRAHFHNTLSMQLELDLYNGGDHLRHVWRLPQAPCESHFHRTGSNLARYPTC